MQVQNFDERKIVSTIPALGTRVVMCRSRTDDDPKSPIEFAIVDIAFWAVDEIGETVAHIFDSELGKPVSLEWALLNYGGLCATSGILESKASVLAKNDMDRLERIVRKKQVKFLEYRDSAEAAAYREAIRRRLGYSNLS